MVTLDHLEDVSSSWQLMQKLLDMATDLEHGPLLLWSELRVTWDLLELILTSTPTLELEFVEATWTFIFLGLEERLALMESPLTLQWEEPSVP